MISNLVKSLLPNAESLEPFLQTFNEEKDKGLSNFKLLKFDTCINENQGHKL